MAEALRIVVLGAECTGKSEITQSLHTRIEALGHLRVAAVSEWLREWCDLQQRTPLQHEQAAIAGEQQRRIEAASLDHDVVICDTTALMTAVYSIWYFDDHSLMHSAVKAHSQTDLILLTALDIPWQADGLQRDGEAVREPIDDLLRRALHQNGLNFTVIHGAGLQRADAAWLAVAGALPQRQGSTALDAHMAPGLRSSSNGERRSGIFSDLLDPNGPRASTERRRGAWSCECCVPEAEQALLKALKLGTGA